MEFLALHFRPLVGDIPALWSGLQLTLLLSATGIAFGGGVGLLFATWRFMVPRWLSWPVTAYVEAIRNTPLLVQLYIIYLGLPAVGVRLTPLAASMLGLTLNLGAYSTEIFRAGFDSIKRPQIEAGEALAFSRLQVLRHVVLVPAVSRVWPALIGQFILMMLGTSICSFISLNELSGTAFTIASATFMSFEVYVIIGVLYLGLTVAMKVLFAVLGPSLFADTISARSVGAGFKSTKGLKSTKGPGAR
ncbi:MAG: amino acid ABC transporter permease [Acetobacteraceae bacterium]